MTTNLINYWNLQETKRANRAREDELRRHQQQDEAIKREQNSINLQLGQGNLLELTRSNKAKESENTRTNIANEEIRRYSNTIAGKQLGIESVKARAAENQSLAAVQNAATQSILAGETKRSNLANEAIKSGTLAENSRHNMRSENLTNFKNLSDRAVQLANLNEQKRHAQVTEGETKRRNLVDQYLQSLELQNRVQTDSARLKVDLLNGTLLNAGKLLQGGSRYGR